MRRLRAITILAVLAAPGPLAANPPPPPGIPATPPITKDQAKQIYNNLDPATQAQVKQQAAAIKAQADANPGFKAWLKQIYHAWFGP